MYGLYGLAKKGGFFLKILCHISESEMSKLPLKLTNSISVGDVPQKFTLRTALCYQ